MDQRALERLGHQVVSRRVALGYRNRTDLASSLQFTIRTLADRLSLRHHSTVELIDRMESHAFVKRTPGREDRRQVIVQLLPRGEKLLEQVVEKRIIELRSNGRALVDAIGALLEPKAPPPKPARKNSRKQARRIVSRAKALR